jgi:tRNA pseudouridine38-40 synthase
VAARLLLEYDGTAFAGWARQPGRRSVQEELETALAVVRREPTALTVAGRTDAGVHALAQVASHAGDPAAATSLNALLPPDVAVLRSEVAPDGFDARRDATSRAYAYRVLARRERSAFEHPRALWFPRPLYREALHACAAALPGTHDFTAFTPTETYHQRFSRHVFAAEWREDGDQLEFRIEADTFMRHMNRVLVGTMLEAATGARTVESFVALLDGAPRSAAGATAPAHGLYLLGVGYGGERLLLGGRNQRGPQLG